MGLGVVVIWIVAGKQSTSASDHWLETLAVRVLLTESHHLPNVCDVSLTSRALVRHVAHEVVTAQDLLADAQAYSPG